MCGGIIKHTRFGGHYLAIFATMAGAAGVHKSGVFRITNSLKGDLEGKKGVLEPAASALSRKLAMLFFSL